MSPECQILTAPIGQIVDDKDLDPGCAAIPGRVEEAAERLRQDPKALPPVQVVRDGDRLLLAVGRHQYEAWRSLGVTTIPVEVLPPARGLTARQQALVAAIDSAMGRTRALTLADRKHCCDLLLIECRQWPDTRVARHSGVCRQTVATHRKTLYGATDPPPAVVPAKQGAAQLARAVLRIEALSSTTPAQAVERALAMALFEAAGTQARAAADWLSERVEGAYGLLGAAFSTASAAAAGISSTEPAAGCPDPVRQVVRRMLEKGPETPETILAGVYLAGVVEPAPVADDDPRLPGDCHPEWRPAFTWRLGWRDAASAAIAALVAAGEVALCSGLLELVNGKERP